MILNDYFNDVNKENNTNCTKLHSQALGFEKQPLSFLQ